MILNWLLNSVPVSAWVILITFGVAALFYFFSPFISALPNWLKISIVFIASVGIALLAGRKKGRDDAKVEQAALAAKAEQIRKQIDDSVSKLSDSDLDRRLDGWMRD